MDALGSQATCNQAIGSLREQGCHLQVGLLLGEDFQPRLVMQRVIARELRIMGSHGLPASAYPRLIDLISQGKLDPRRLVGQTISLQQAGAALAGMGQFTGTGVTVIDRFA
jgi:alcohol dehydrogenase